MSLSMEQAADSFFVKGKKQSHTVASTLVKFTKLVGNYSIQSRYKCELFVHFCRDSLEQRILHLLSDKQYKAFPIKHVLLGMFFLALISTTSVDGIHHAIEVLFTH